MVQEVDTLAAMARRVRRRFQVVTSCAWACVLAAFIVVSANAADLSDPPPAGHKSEREVCRYLHGGAHKLGCGKESEVEIKRPEKGMLIYELNRFPNSEPTAEQQKVADEMVAKSVASAKAHGWFNFQKAKADGFQLLPGDPLHYLNMKYINDEHVLDPERPEYLLYFGKGKERKLVAMMFIMNSLEDDGPQFGGPLTRWHFHYWSSPWCLKNGRATLEPAPIDEKCEVGTPSYRGAQMMHVWLLPHPDGRFATKMHLSDKLFEKLIAKRGY